MRRRFSLGFEGRPAEGLARDRYDRLWFIDYLLRHAPPEGVGSCPEADPSELRREDDTEPILLIE